MMPSEHFPPEYFPPGYFPEYTVVTAWPDSVVVMEPDCETNPIPFEELIPKE